MNDIFAQVRQQVGAQDAARRFGLEFDRRGWCKCPFHRDRRASMSFKNGRWRCWVCNEGGDSIDLTAKLFGLSPLGAAERLDREFSLGLPLRRRPTARDVRAARRQQELADTRQLFRLWQEDTIRQLNRCLLTAHLALRDTQTQADWDGLSAAQVAAIRWQSYFEYLSDLLSGGSPEEQMEIFRQRKAVLLRIEQILSPTQRRSAAA